MEIDMDIKTLESSTELSIGGSHYKSIRVDIQKLTFSVCDLNTKREYAIPK